MSPPSPLWLSHGDGRCNHVGRWDPPSLSGRGAAPAASPITPCPALALSPKGHLKYSPFTSAYEPLVTVQVAAWESRGCHELCQGHGGVLFPWDGQWTLHGWEHPTRGLGSSPLSLFPFLLLASCRELNVEPLKLFLLQSIFCISWNR